MSTEEKQRQLLHLIQQVQKDDLPLENLIPLLSDIFRILTDVPEIIRGDEQLRPIILSFVNDFRCLKAKENELDALLQMVGDEEGADAEDIEFMNNMKILLQTLRTIQANMDSIEHFIKSL